MPPLKVDFAPYAPSSNILSIINRLRNKGLPEPLGQKELATLGIPEGSISRVLQALRFLSLIDEDGHLTPTFHDLGKAPEDEYREILAELLKTAYERIFVSYEPSQITDDELGNAFRAYEPRAQRSRMITFFVAMCREAGLMPQERVVTQHYSRSAIPSPAKKTRVTSRKIPDTQTSLKLETSGREQDERAIEHGELLPSKKNSRYNLLQVFFQGLPENGKWSKARKDKWISALVANIEYLTETVEEDEENE